MCRASFTKPIYIPRVDLKLQDEIKEKLGQEYESAKAKLIREGKYVTTRMVRFTYGNTWELVDYPEARDGSGKSNKWTMQLSINDGNENVSKYIKSVTYILHPNYSENVIEVK